MASVHEILKSVGVRAEQIRQERFTIGAPPSTSPTLSIYIVDFAKSGRKYECSSADSLISVAERHGIAMPSSCRVGQCGTCATRVLEGEVEMEVDDDGLDPEQRHQGYRLVCVGRPRSNVRLEA